MSKFAKFTLIKFVLPTDTSSEEFCTAYYFLHGSLEGKFSVVKSCNTILVNITSAHTVVATSTCTSLKPSISPSNVALNSNPGTVLETARPEDSKTPPTC